MDIGYTGALSGVFLVLVTVLAQHAIASAVKAKEPGAIPGKIDDALSHDSFVFRAHRTFWNSIENLPLFLGSVALAIALGVDSGSLAMAVWVFALARVAHMGLYYAIATERNPSPRSYAFMIGYLANIVILGLCLGGLIG